MQPTQMESAVNIVIDYAAKEMQGVTRKIPIQSSKKNHEVQKFPAR